MVSESASANACCAWVSLRDLSHVPPAATARITAAAATIVLRRLSLRVWCTIRSTVALPTPDFAGAAVAAAAAGAGSSRGGAVGPASRVSGAVGAPSRVSFT
jgi:hypothetical protein